MPELFSDLVETPRGIFIIHFSQKGLYEINFPGSSLLPEYPRKTLPWKQLEPDLCSYLEGEIVDWNRYPLDCSGYRSFTAALLHVVSSIPYGRTLSYREAARLAGSPLAWRAAGQALGSNRHPIIVPCHRVIGSDGGEGGFSGPAGWKKILLELEGVYLKGWPTAEKVDGEGIT